MMADDDDHLADCVWEDDDDDYDELQAELCGSRRKHQCDLAGTEWCDWKCPLHDEVFPPAKAKPAPLLDLIDKKDNNDH